MGQMIKLKYLELDFNGFCGPVPSFLGNLHRLMRLKLNANAFQGTLPSSLMNLKLLQTIEADKEQLSNIPRDVVESGGQQIRRFLEDLAGREDDSDED
jgi:hypothetical protein